MQVTSVEVSDIIFILHLYKNSSAKTRALIFYKQNEPILTSLHGNELSCLGFTIARDVDVYESCAVTYKDKFYVYGGYTNKRQIATINKLSLVKVGTLPFDFEFGGCTSTADQLFLCFDFMGDLKTCYQTKNPIDYFYKTNKTNHEHRNIRFASSESKFFFIAELFT